MHLVFDRQSSARLPRSMRNSFTMRNIALAVLAAVLIVGAGITAGAMIRGGPVQRLAPGGALVEVHLADGSVFLGSLREETNDYLTLTGGAIVIPQSTASGQASRRVHGCSMPSTRPSRGSATARTFAACCC